MKDKINEFRDELSNLINRLSMEGRSNTADHVLAGYLVHCLLAFEGAKRASNNLEPISLREAASPTIEEIDAAASHLAASPTEEKVECSRCYDVGNCPCLCETCHQKEQPTHADELKRIMEKPYEEQPKCNCSSSPDFYTGPHFHQCPLFEEHPEKPKGIEKIEVLAGDFDGMAPNVAEFLELLVETANELVDALNLLTTKQ